MCLCLFNLIRATITLLLLIGLSDFSVLSPSFLNIFFIYLGVFVCLFFVSACPYILLSIFLISSLSSIIIFHSFKTI